MNTESQFLELIRADLDNPAPRLVYADWLDEQGDPRGEFIRVQCELENPGLSTLKLRRLRQRERELLDLYEAEWLEPIAALKLKTADWKFRRGFVEEVAIDVDEFLYFEMAIPRAFPSLHSLKLRCLNRTHIEPLSNCLALGSFTDVHFSTHPRFITRRRDFEADEGELLDGADLKRLLSSHNFDSVQSLDWKEATYYAENGLDAVLSCPNIRLHSLDLSRIRLDMDFVRTLAGSSCIRELRELYLGSTSLDINHLLVLTYSGFLRQLEILDLRLNRFCSLRNMGSLSALHRFSNLKQLDLRSCLIGDVGIEAIAHTSLWQTLECLVLWNNEITDRGLIAIAEGEPPAKLPALELQRNAISDAGVSALATSPVLRAFSKIHLEHNRIEDQGALMLAGSGYAENLTELHLRGNPSLGDQGGIALASAGFPALEVLDLAATQVGDPTAMAIAESSTSARLRILDMGQTRITAQGAIALAESEFLNFLEFLDLRMNQLTGNCVTALKEKFGNRVLV